MVAVAKLRGHPSIGDPPPHVVLRVARASIVTSIIVGVELWADLVWLALDPVRVCVHTCVRLRCSVESPEGVLASPHATTSWCGSVLCTVTTVVAHRRRGRGYAQARQKAWPLGPPGGCTCTPASS